MTREPEPYFARMREVDVGPGVVDVWLVGSPYGLPPQFLATLILTHGRTGVPMCALHPN